MAEDQPLLRPPFEMNRTPCFEMGQSVRDLLSGFTGLVVARAVFWGGAQKWLVQPPVNSDNMPAEPTWVEECRLEAVPGRPPAIGYGPPQEPVGDNRTAAMLRDRSEGPDSSSEPLP